jgi:putative ABC transport system ATP-binding protein
VRSHLSVIGEGRFVASTIKNNLVGFMESPATITQMEDALETVGLLDKIKSLPDGLDTQLLSNGFPLSISETIALQAARVLVMKPSIVIVTSDFDKMAYEKRKKVKEALLKDTAPWTLVFLTQKILRGDFDRFGVLERAGLRELSSEASLFMEVEKYE